MKKNYKVGIVGASGLVAGELRALLEARDFPVEALSLFGGMEDAGEAVEFRGETIGIEAMRSDYHQGLDLVFFAAHPLVSRDLAENAAQAGVTVIDASRTFRLDRNTPLVTPELNAHRLAAAGKGGRIIASPGPCAIALALVLHGIGKEFGIERATALALYPSSFEGRAGLDEHQEQTVALLNQQEFKVARFPRQTAFNIFPQVGKFNGAATEEEQDVAAELKKILERPDLRIAVTCAQVPVFVGISILLGLETGKPASEEKLRDLLAHSPGVAVLDHPEQDQYPDLMTSMDSERVLAGRIRRDPDSDRHFQIWISADNLRKGSSLNMVAIAEKLIELKLI